VETLLGGRHPTLLPAKKTAPEPLSPELVLVDPELASLARERLRVARDSSASGKRAASTTRQGPAEGRADARAASDDYAERLPKERLPEARAAPRAQDDRLEPPTAVPEEALEIRAISPDHAERDPPLARTRPHRRRVFVAALAILGVAAASFPIVAHEVTVLGDREYAYAPTQKEPKPAQRTADARQNRRTSGSPSAGAGSASRHSTKAKAATKPKKRLRPVAPSEFSTRVFVWPAVSRARFYKVEFFRRGRKIFEASPTMPRIELPLRWVFRGRHFRLTRTTYKWEVRAAFGPRSRPRYGKLITQSTWTAK